MKSAARTLKESGLTPRLRDLLHREAHLKLYRAQTTKQLHETAVPELRAQYDQVQTDQTADIRSFLFEAWEQFRADVAPQIRPEDTERSVAETEQMVTQNRPAVLPLARMTGTGADASHANGVQRQENATERVKNAG